LLAPLSLTAGSIGFLLVGVVVHLGHDEPRTIGLALDDPDVEVVAVRHGLASDQQLALYHQTDLAQPYDPSAPASPTKCHAQTRCLETGSPSPDLDTLMPGLGESDSSRVQDVEVVMDTWQAIDEERLALADDLAAFDDSQWDAQSLCREWKIRHVVGHLVGGADVKAGPFLAGMLRSGMNFNRCMAREGLALGAVPPDELLEQFRNTVGMRRTPPGAKPEVMLTDLVCHCGDIRRPTGITRRVPEATLLSVADTVKGVGFPIWAKKRIAGLRMSPTDSDWSAGDGPPVEGPLASLILVMAGRKAPLEDLWGEGAQILQARV
jgi:uncharacterized protein (TIGR03083 family)